MYDTPNPNDHTAEHQAHWPPDLFNVIFIPLSQGKFAAIDKADYPLIAGRRWYASVTQHGARYAKSANYIGDYKTRPLHMHRIITAAKRGQTVDHRDNDGFNNRRGNLRVCTQQQNSFARHRVRARSGYKGVEVQGRTFYAKITFHGKTIRLGSFKDPVLAAKAYDAKAIELFGEFAVPNFHESNLVGAA